MPDLLFDKILDVARRLKVILNPERAPREAAAPRVEDQVERPKNALQSRSERQNARRKRRDFARAQRRKIKSKKRKLTQKKQELRRTKDEPFDAKSRTELVDYRERKKSLQQEIFQLKWELQAAEESWAVGDKPVTGTLPDFVVIGGKKCGTTFFYHLLSQHPLVEPAASKELHFFNSLFDRGIEWYRGCFPAPQWKGGRKTITGEASAEYLFDPLVPERMAKVVPQAWLIALLRNPVDRAYSDYQQMVRKGRESQTFEEAIGYKGIVEADGAWPLNEVRNDTGDLDDEYGYLSRSVYVNHLQRWSRFFPRVQLLVLVSEDLFERPLDTLKDAFGFLGLPGWEPDASLLGSKRRTGSYEQEMDPATRRRLEEYFEPHNKRLYEFLGREFGW